MAKNIEIIKGNLYVCTEDVFVGNEVFFKKDQIYKATADGYVEDVNGISRSFNLSGEFHFRLATAEEIAIGRALTEEQQLLVEELELKIKLAKIDFMKCGLSEEQALAQVDLVVKNAIREVYHPKK